MDTSNSVRGRCWIIATIGWMCSLSLTAQLAIPVTNPPLAILKLSCNGPHDPHVIGGICGAAFFLDSKTALSVEHVVNEVLLAPNLGLQKCQLWLLGPNVLAEFWKSNVVALPNLDAVVIRFPTPVAGAVPVVISQIPAQLGETVFNVGFVGGTMPEINAAWNESSLSLLSFNLERNYIGGMGTLTFVGFEERRSDVRISATVMRTSYGGRIGMSGGPLIRLSTGEVIGLMSYGLPPGSEGKTNLAAVSLIEIQRTLASMGNTNR